MKKKRYLLLLAAAMMMIGMTGCSDSKDVNDDEVAAEDVIDEISDVVDDLDHSHYYFVQSYGFDEAVLEVTRVNDAGENELEETGSEGWMGEAGMTIAQLMDEWDVVSIDAKCEGYDLLGWQAYESVREVDEDGFETFSEQQLYDGQVFTTDEILNMELPDADIYFNTVWDLTCSQCEKQKVCEIYYIDDDCYFVCDDCYDMFARGVGLE